MHRKCTFGPQPVYLSKPPKGRSCAATEVHRRPTVEGRSSKVAPRRPKVCLYPLEALLDNLGSREARQSVLPIRDIVMQGKNKNMPRAQLSREAYAEIRSGRLSVREAKKKYHIYQARYARIRGNKEEHTPARTQDQPDRGGAAGDMVDGNNFQRAVPQLFLSKKEKQFLELSGHSFYERSQIPRQFLELYILAALPPRRKRDGSRHRLYLPPKPAAGKIRYILAEAKPVERHTGKCTDCLATAPDSVLPPALFSGASTCKCGATDHCSTSEKCILWKSKDIPTGPPPKLRTPEPQKRSKPGFSATSRTYTTATAFGGPFDMCALSEVWRRSAHASAIHAYGGGWLDPISAKILD